MREKKKLAVVAIGGNAVTPDATRLSTEDQYATICDLAEHLVDMYAQGWNMLLVHGNGPQVGLSLRRSELAENEVPPISMDTAGAEVQGGMGSMFVKALFNAFARRNLSSTPAALVTHTLVSLDDPAFGEPTKPIGSWMSEERARELAARLGWTVQEDSGRGWRRVVPSPVPLQVIEKEALKALMQQDAVVVAGGGGGIPVARDSRGMLVGVEAVIDKDRTSALLACALEADALVVTTGIDRVAVRFGTPEQEWLDVVTVDEADKYRLQGEFGKGSMEPKVEALSDYVRKTGGTAIICSLAGMPDALAGKAGTRIVKD